MEGLGVAAGIGQHFIEACSKVFVQWFVKALLGPQMDEIDNVMGDRIPYERHDVSDLRLVARMHVKEVGRECVSKARFQRIEVRGSRG